MDLIRQKANEARDFAIEELKKRNATDADIQYLNENWERYYGKITQRGGLDKAEEIAGNFIALAISIDLLIDDEFNQI